VVNKTVVSVWSVTVEIISDSVVAEDVVDSMMAEEVVDSVANVTAEVVIAGVVTTETEVVDSVTSEVVDSVALEVVDSVRLLLVLRSAPKPNIHLGELHDH